jgi:hypothetical protein
LRTFIKISHCSTSASTFCDPYAIFADSTPWCDLIERKVIFRVLRILFGEKPVPIFSQHALMLLALMLFSEKPVPIFSQHALMLLALMLFSEKPVPTFSQHASMTRGNALHPLDQRTGGLFHEQNVTPMVPSRRCDVGRVKIGTFYDEPGGYGEISVSGGMSSAKTKQSCACFFLMLTLLCRTGRHNIGVETP